MTAALVVLCSPIVVVTLLTAVGFALRNRKWPNPPIYKLKDFLPSGVEVNRWKFSEGSASLAQALVVQRGTQDEDTPVVVFVPGFSEDYRLGLLAFQQWMLCRDSFRLIVLLKRGYSDPFVNCAIETVDFETRFPELGPNFTIHEDAEIVRRIIESQKSKNLILWGHSQGGATAQEALTQFESGQFSVREDVAARLKAVVLEASVLPGSGFATLVGLIPFKFLAYVVVPIVPFTLKIKPYLLIGPALDRLYSAGHWDRDQRLSIYDRNMLRFEFPRVAIDNAFSLRVFASQRQRIDVLRQLFSAQKLYGLFPRTEDLILDTLGNRRVMCEVASLPLDTTTESGYVKIVENTHCVGLENPQLVERMLREIEAS